MICLVGLRGSGKTTVGNALAVALGRAFVDLDRALERRIQSTIPALFAARGEEVFRELEAHTLREALLLLSRGVARGSVVATGGGVVLREDNRELLKQARVVYLAADPEVVGARVAADGDGERPPLAEGGPRAEAQALFAVRDPLYRDVAQAVVDASQGPEEVVAAIRQELGV